MPEDQRQTLRQALADPALRDEWPVLRELERVVDELTTTRSAAVLLGAIIARMRGQWAQVEAMCRSLTTTSSGSRRDEQAYAWFLISAAADAQHRWQRARAARRRVRQLMTPRHVLWLATGIGDLEQATRLRRSREMAAVRRWLARAERRTPLPECIRYRLDLAWLESCTLSSCPVTRGAIRRLQRAVAALLPDTRQATPRIRSDLVRLLRVAVALRAIDIAHQILACLDQPTRPPDDRTAVAVEVDILAGQVAVARGQHVAALRHSTTARVGLFQITGDPEHDRLTAALDSLDVAVRQHLRRVERP